MLPVSGAEQLKTSAPKPGTRPMISHSGAYSTLVRPAPYSLSGRNRFHRPAARAFGLSASPPGAGGARLRLERFDDGRRLPAIAVGDLSVERRFVGIDVLVHERVETPLKLDDLAGMIEAHGAHDSLFLMDSDAREIRTGEQLDWTRLGA